MSWRGYMVGTYGCARADAAANYRMQNPHRSIGMSNRAAAAALNGGSSSCPSSSRTSTKNERKLAQSALAEAAESGQGITKAELRDIVSDALDRHGSKDELHGSTRRAIRQAVRRGDFARKSTAQLALQLSQGQITPADIGARFGRAG